MGRPVCGRRGPRPSRGDRRPSPLWTGTRVGWVGCAESSEPHTLTLAIAINVHEHLVSIDGSDVWHIAAENARIDRFNMPVEKRFVRLPEVAACEHRYNWGRIHRRRLAVDIDSSAVSAQYRALRVTGHLFFD